MKTAYRVSIRRNGSNYQKDWYIDDLTRTLGMFSRLQINLEVLRENGIDISGYDLRYYRSYRTSQGKKRASVQERVTY